MTDRPDVPHDEALRALLAERLGNHSPVEHPLDGRRHAAVAIVVVDSDRERHGDDPVEAHEIDMSMVPGDVPSDLDGRVDGTAGGAAILLTRRTPRLRSHAKQWALPGGRIDAGETPFEAVCREVAEEVGLVLGPDHLLGRLDDYPTRSGYVMSPFVFWVDHAEPVPNPDEVHSLHRISLRELTRPDSPRFITIPESERPVIQLRIGRDLIHAPTGAVIHQFRRLGIDGTYERVDLYEQPVFAWK